MADDRDDLRQEGLGDEPGPSELGRAETMHAAAGAVTVAVSGLSLFTSHGVSEAERELGQRLVIDVALQLDACEARETDRIEDTVDYVDVCEQVALAAQERSYRTLERLCEVTAQRLLERYGAASVKLRASKPEPPIALPVEAVSVEVLKER